MVIAGGLGSTVWDHDGRRYLDFSSQLVNTNIGHQHPRVVAAIQEQAATLTTVAPATANLTRGRAAQKRPEPRARRVLAACSSPTAAPTPTRTRSGMARLHTGRDKVVSAYRSYHGNTGAAVVATGDWRRVPNEYARGHVHHFGPYLYRSEFWATTPEQESERALHHLERVIQAEGPGVGRGDPAGDDPRHGRRARAAARLPRGRPRDRRPVRDPADPRRGHGRLRPHRAVVRVRRVRRASRTSSPSPRASTPATSRRAA